jgi:hypothetical protein
VIQQRLLELEGQHYQLELNRQQLLSADIISDDERAVIAAKAEEIEAIQAALDIRYASDAAALEELTPKKLNAKAKT